MYDSTAGFVVVPIMALLYAFIIAALAMPPLLMLLIARHKRWHGIVRIILLLLVAWGYTFWIAIPFYQAYDYEKKTEAAQAKGKAEIAAHEKEDYAYFQKKCAEDSGRFIYKTVTEPQESVYMMKPRKEATPQELADQFWMGDPYGMWLGQWSLLQKQKNAEGDELPMFSFVETHDLDHPDQLWRYYLRGFREPEDGSCPYDTRSFRCEPAENIQSRYGITWDDLSSNEDRRYWVAKSRLQIIDLQTKEVMAERIGYVSGKRYAKQPWERAYPVCPKKKIRTSSIHDWSADGRWIWSVLNNLPFDERERRGP
ncbi:MAG: hypothetical protein LBQ75_10730 [Zoogloeaceae bacterium]|jgi:hypothetical protein|nr:hypothetical protein [Zoogloeaceae bacterium]